jgi:uncharacterized surface protein with fasciclin (FAS1) repeats
LGFLLENPDLLVELLTYHVAAGETFSSSLSDGMMIPTLLAGESLSVAIAEGIVTLNGVAVVGPADVVALNGVIHVIDTVLLPPGFVENLPADLVDTAVTAGFSTLVTAVGAAGLADALKGGIFTVFAPTDAAFAALPEGALDFLLANTMLLAEVLTYHVASGATFSSELSDGMMIPTLLEGESLSVGIAMGTVTINGVAIVGPADVEALNGVIHVIDTVLLPPGFELVPDTPTAAMEPTPTAMEPTPTAMEPTPTMAMDPTAAPAVMAPAPTEASGALTAGNVMALLGSLAVAAGINAF